MGFRTFLYFPKQRVQSKSVNIKKGDIRVPKFDKELPEEHITSSAFL